MGRRGKWRAKIGVLGKSPIYGPREERGPQGGKRRPERWEERGASRGPGGPGRGMWPTMSKLSLVLPCYISHCAFMFLFKVL